MDFRGAHIISVSQFERDDIGKVFAVADSMEPYANRKRITKALNGAIPVSYTHLTLPTKA